MRIPILSCSQFNLFLSDIFLPYDNRNLKYLKNFKWDYLTEKFAYERREREQRVKASMLQAKRANSEFAELVDKQKAETFIKERKRKADAAGDTKSGRSSSGGEHAEKLHQKRVRIDAVIKPKKSVSQILLQKIL